MLKPVAWALLLSLTAWAKPTPYRDPSCQVHFPGTFSCGEQAVSYVRPHLQVYLLSWPTSPSQAIALLANLYQQAKTRGCAVRFLSKNHAQGLQILEVLTGADRTISQFYLLHGRCYEFRACIHDGRPHPEVDAFFDSIRFRARTVNLSAAIQNYRAPAPAAVPVYRYGPESACVDKLKHIHNQAVHYASNHRGQYPASLSQLSLSPLQMTCPLSGRSSYVMLCSASGVVVYCQGRNHQSEGYPSNYPRVSGRALVPTQPPVPPPAPANPYTF